MVDVILIHGTTQSAAGYGPLAGELAARGHRPLAPDLPADRPAEWIGEDPATDTPAACYFLFHDVDLATLRWALRTRQSFRPDAAYHTPFPKDGHASAPSTYVVCRRDRALRPEWQRRAARERLGATTVELDVGHAPHVSAPELVADPIELPGT